jgi:hypothetical protein
MSILFDLSALSADLRAEIESSPKWVKFFSAKPKQLLGVDSNAKTVKGQALGFYTAILYLSPADISGVNLCPLAKLAGCEQACLASAGRGAFRSVFMARLRKTLFFLQYQSEFLDMLKLEISRLSRKFGSQLLVRLNGTSDIRWELLGIPQAFPDVQFYDYTKLPNRKGITANYDLTFSGSGVPEYQPIMFKAKSQGMRIAMVFRSRESIPSSFDGMTVVDGDNSDIRHLDPQGVIVGLYAKGKAKTDRSGFVI